MQFLLMFLLAASAAAFFCDFQTEKKAGRKKHALFYFLLSFLNAGTWIYYFVVYAKELYEVRSIFNI